MKRFLLISMFALLFVSANFAQFTVYINGTVTEINTGQPISNHPVYIMSDSTTPGFFYYNTVYTDINGEFEDSVSVPNLFVNFYFYTVDCNGIGQLGVANIMGNNISVSFQICGGTPSNCQAIFAAFPDPADTTGHTYYFLENCIGGVPLSYSWHFGDGTYSSLQNPIHTYNSSGVFTVCLTIVTANCTNTACDSIWVGPQPCYNYFYDSIFNMDAYFYGVAYNGVAPYTYTWDFGDGASGTGNGVGHTYASSGYFLITLTTIDGNGCIATSTQYIYVGVNLSYLYGQVTANGNWLDYGKVSLFIQNPVTAAFYLIDTTSIDSSGYYWFNNIVQGTYYILATPSSNSSYYATYAPTYYQSAIFWAGATPIIIGTVANPYNISLAAILGPSPGNGNISGTITEGAKLFAQGPPVPNIEILLLNTSNQPLSMVYSDASGQFAFHNLAMGTYKVYAEIAGLTTIPYIITLTTNAPDNNFVNLVKTPNGITTGLPETPAIIELSILNVYPNPAKDFITIAVESAKPDVITAELFDLAGKLVMTQTMNINTGKASYQLDVNKLQAGFYNLSLTSDKGLKITQKLTLLP